MPMWFIEEHDLKIFGVLRSLCLDVRWVPQRASLAELDALFASLEHRAFRGEL